MTAATQHQPAAFTSLLQQQPILDRLPDWQSAISASRDYRALPTATKRYVSRLEELIAVPIKWLSVGPSHDATIAF